MTQFNLDTPIVAATKSGTQLASDLSNWRDAIHTMHSGTTAPSYRQTGTQWFDTTHAQFKYVKIFDGTDWITKMAVDITNNVAYEINQSPRYTYPLTAGTQPAYTLTLAPALTSYTDGHVFTAEIHASNTAAATLNINGIGAKAIRRLDTLGADAALRINDLLIAARYTFSYDSAANAGAGAFIVVNPSLVRAAEQRGCIAFVHRQPFPDRVSNALNFVIDPNEIQCRNNGAASALNLNASGGSTVIGLSGGTDLITQNGQVQVQDVLQLVRGASLTIAGGVITVTSSHHAVDTQAAAATDDLDTINGAVGDGHVLIIRPVSSSRTIVVKNGTGNINCRGAVDIPLGSSATGLMLVYNGATWMGNT